MTKSKGSTYFYAIIGITLVLLVLGVAGTIGIEARRITTDLKENLTVEIVLRDSIDAKNISGLQEVIKGKPYVKNIRFVTKEEAAKLLQEKYPKENFDILGYNPLYNSFLINLFENYATEESMNSIRQELSSLPEVEQVNAQTDVLQNLTKNTGKASLIMLILAGLLLAFAISLIFNTIRLAMYASRFTIKTMQLFGATRWFIIKPLLGKSILNGLFSGLLACLLLGAGIGYFDYTNPELGLQRDLVTFALLFGALVLFGILISFFSTLTAVLRYLRIKLEYLY